MLKDHQVIDAIKAGIISKEPLLPVEGKGSQTNLRILNELARVFTDWNRPYLEIGVYKGATLLNVAYANPTTQCFGLEDYSQFDGTLAEFTKTKTKYRINNAHIENYDFEYFLAQPPSRKIGMAYVDGAHDYRSQIMALLLLSGHMAFQGCIVIDDCNYGHVRQSVLDFLKTNTNWRLVYEAYADAHPERSHMTQAGNGINVIVRGFYFAPMFPAPGNKERFLRDHAVHQDRYADEVEKALKLYRMISFHKPRAFKSMNTDSNKLKTRLNDIY